MHETLRNLRDSCVYAPTDLPGEVLWENAADDRRWTTRSGRRFWPSSAWDAARTWPPNTSAARRARSSAPPSAIRSSPKKLREAKGNAELGLVKNIRNAAKKEQYWRAAAWALERGFPEKYARRGPDVITVEQIGLLLTQILRDHR